jgi:hypothetical protein
MSKKRSIGQGIFQDRAAHRGMSHTLMPCSCSVLSGLGTQYPYLGLYFEARHYQQDTEVEKQPHLQWSAPHIRACQAVGIVVNAHEAWHLMLKFAAIKNTWSLGSYDENLDTQKSECN